MPDMNYKKLLNQLITNCPVPVRFCSFGRDVPEGRYYPFESRIEIDNCGTIYDTIVSLFHEHKHAIDNAQDEQCIHSKTMREYSAMAYSLKRAYKLRDKNIIKAVIDDITWSIDNGEPYHAHYKAAKKIQKLKTWGKCVELLDNKIRT